MNVNKEREGDQINQKLDRNGKEKTRDIHKDSQRDCAGWRTSLGHTITHIHNNVCRTNTTCHSRKEK